MKKHNFSAGPCILPEEVLKKASESVLNFNNDNLSLIEISHRSKPFVEVMEKAIKLVRNLLNVPENYAILFLQGGASLEFLMTPYNLLSSKGICGYINTGAWSEKALKEAKKLGEVLTIGDSSDKNYNYIPKNLIIPENLDYLHYTSNNTIYGTQFKAYPETNNTLVCDMSSDIFSKKIDVSKYGLIYAEAGISHYDICWYACANNSGNLVMLGLAGGSEKLKTKIGMGVQDILGQRWNLIEADANYTINDSFGISLGIADLDEFGGKLTKLGFRLSW